MMRLPVTSSSTRSAEGAGTLWLGWLMRMLLVRDMLALLAPGRATALRAVRRRGPVPHCRPGRAVARPLSGEGDGMAQEGVAPPADAVLVAVEDRVMTVALN